MGIRYKKFSQEKSHSWEFCKNVNLVFPIMVIYNNINVFLKNFPCGDNSIWCMVGSESGRSSRTATLGSVIRIPAITFYLRTIRMAHRTRRWELLTRLVRGSLCTG